MDSRSIIYLDYTLVYLNMSKKPIRLCTLRIDRRYVTLKFIGFRFTFQSGYSPPQFHPSLGETRLTQYICLLLVWSAIQRTTCAVY